MSQNRNEQRVVRIDARHKEHQRDGVDGRVHPESCQRALRHDAEVDRGVHVVFVEMDHRVRSDGQERFDDDVCGLKQAEGDVATADVGQVGRERRKARHVGQEPHESAPERVSLRRRG